MREQIDGFYMAGHSKWANIKHRKSAQDARRGKIFTKLIREITIAAKMGGGDADANPRLRAAIDKALSHNMTKDTIGRAIKRGVGGDDDSNLFEITYEGYGPAGVAVMVECLSDNKNRTVGEVRHAFSKCGGNLGTDGSVAYLFNKQGLLRFEKVADEDGLMEAALEAGAEDISNNSDGSVEIYTQPEDLMRVKDALVAAGFSPDETELAMIPSTEVNLELEDAQKLLKLQDMLEDLDDVQKVHTNADISDEVMNQLL